MQRAIALDQETDAASAHIAGRRSFQRVVVGLVALFYAIAVLGPSARHGYSTELDASWPLFLHYAFDHQLQFGTDVVYTFGPWGFLFDRNAVPATAWASLLAWSTLSVAVWAGALFIARRAFRSALAALAWILALLASLASTNDGAFFGIVAVCLFTELVDDRALRARDAHRWLLLVALGLVSLVKFTYFVSAVAVVALLTARRAWIRREALLAPFVFLASLIGFWVLAAQSLANIPSYLRWAAEIARSYPQAMSLQGPFREVVAISIASGTLVLVGAWIANARDRLSVAALLSTLLFVVFKASVVRHDGPHVLTAASVLITVALLEFAWWEPPRNGMQRGWIPVALLLCSAIGLWLFGNNSGGRWDVLTRPVAACARQLEVLTPRSAETDSTGMADRSLDLVRTAYPLPSIEGTTDVYPWQAALPIAHGLQYRPRPIFQSFQATSEALATLNADHLRGLEAPDVLLFDVESVDNRLPALDDAPSWPLLWSHYQADVLTPSFAVLRRRADPKAIVPTLLERRRVSLGEPFRVPSPGTGVVWAEIHVDETEIGKARSLLLRPAEVTVQIETADGLLRRFRLVPEIARGGFVLSPLVLDRMAFVARWAQSGPPDLQDVLEGDPVTSVEVIADPRFYRATVDVSLYRLDIPQDVMPAWYDEAAANYLGLRAAHRGVDALVSAALRGGRAAETRDTPAGPVFFAHAPFTFPVHYGGGDSVTVEFGVLDGSWSNGGSTDGVEFAVLGRCQPNPLWSRTLRPVENPADRGLQRANLPIPRSCRGTPITLRTSPVGTPAWDWSYWRMAQ